MIIFLVHFPGKVGFMFDLLLFFGSGFDGRGMSQKEFSAWKKGKKKGLKSASTTDLWRTRGGVGGESKIVVVHGSFKPVQYNLFVLKDPLDVDSGLLYGLFHRCSSGTQVIGFGKKVQLYKQKQVMQVCNSIEG